MPRQALEVARLDRIDVEMAELNLRLRPGERRRAREGIDVEVTVDRAEQRFT